MQVAIGWRPWTVVLASVLFAVLASAIASGQESESTHRFFGFQGDITIDGNPIGPDVEIVAMIGDEEIGRTTVNPAGAWILDVESSHFENGACNVSFVVDGLRSDQDWDTCSRRVRLTLVSDRASSAGDGTVGEAQAQSDDESARTSRDEDQNGSAEAAGDDSDGLMEAEDETAESTAIQDGDQQIVRPAAPRTGTGGIPASQDSTNWPRAAAITALLTFCVAAAALLIGRRSDSST